MSKIKLTDQNIMNIFDKRKFSEFQEFDTSELTVEYEDIKKEHFDKGGRVICSCGKYIDCVHCLVCDECHM